MSASWLLLTTLIWLQTKHFIADYVLQPAWIIHGKGNLLEPGGYVHAIIHAVATMPILWFSTLDVTSIMVVGIAELVIHFVIDHVKAVHGRYYPQRVDRRAFWVLHGIDQLAHHLTYSAIIALLVWRSNLAGV